MKKSELKSFIKENIIDTLTESASSEEKKMARQAVRRFAKYRGVSEDEAARDLIRAIEELGSLKENYTKEKLLKRIANADDAMIQTGNGREYVIYNPNSNNDDNANMWKDTSVFAVDQDGEEHEIDYEDIGLVMTENLPSKEEIEDTTAAVQVLKKELDTLEEEDDDDDKDAIAQAKKARGKHKKLDIAVKALRDITTDMKSLARKYSSADEVEKEKIKDILKKKTPQKKELESLVAKLEKNAI